MDGQERGQVTPALLLAVIGAFALVTTFFVVSQSQEQSTRSDTAADAAALGAGREWDRTGGLYFAAGLPVTISAKIPLFFPPSARIAAESFAQANGARVRSVTPRGFDPLTLTWEYNVEVEQNDDLEYDGEDQTTRSDATVEVKATGGVCRSGEGAPGYEVTGVCVGPAQMIVICNPTWTGFPRCPLPTQVQAAFSSETRLVS